MDIRGQYIKMCDCPQIQDGWEPKVGDFVYGNRGIYIVRCNYIQGHLVCRVHHNMAYDGIYKAEYNCAIDNLIWLPRLDQLIEMLPKNQGYHILYIADDAVGNKMWHFSSIGDEVNEIWETTHEQAVIQGVMYNLHGLKWNGEKWVDNA